jgi:hypothetical protein
VGVRPALDPGGASPTRPLWSTKGMVDPSMFPQGRVVLVLLKDGTHLEGELIVVTNCYSVGGVVFQEWEIETIEDVT